MRTVAIEPHTRDMGFAVLEEERLINWGIREFRGGDSIQAEGKAFIRLLVDVYDPKFFVIEKTDYAKSRRSTVLHGFVREMEQYVKKQSVRVMSYTPDAVKRAIAGHEGVSKREIAWLLGREFYPQLLKSLQTDKPHKQLYWTNAYSAVGLAVTGYREGMKQKSRYMNRKST